MKGRCDWCGCPIDLIHESSETICDECLYREDWEEEREKEIKEQLEE